MHIRTTTADDAARLQALVATVARERRYLGSTQGFTLPQTESYIHQLRASDGVQLVAVDGEAGQEIVGAGGLLGWVDVSRGPFEGLTHCGRLGMGVAPEARGQGIGRALLAAALTRGFRTLDRIELEVFASNERARALYARAGFVEEGRRRRARKLDGVCDDILMMGLLRDEWTATLTPPA